MCGVYVRGGGGEGACVECMCGVYMCVGGDARVERMCGGVHVGSACVECTCVGGTCVECMCVHTSGCIDKRKEHDTMSSN